MDISELTPENNPLASPQRETAGAQTFEKYEYQYHWALCKLIEAHENLEDYVIFVELHEDVLFATSTDIEKAEFEFTQIKNINSSPFTINKLITPPSNQNSQSILGKMLLGIKGKPFVSKLKHLDLVLTCGYNLNLKENKRNYKLTTITLNDIDEKCLQHIQDSINKELDNYPLPKSLRFIKSELPTESFQDTTNGKLMRLLDKISPKSKWPPLTIYRVLIDDLHRKGTVSNNYLNWENTIKTKGITYSQVTKIILDYSDSNKEYLKDTFNTLILELNLNTFEQIDLRNDFDRYINSVNIYRTLDTINNSNENRNEIIPIIEKNMYIFKNNNFLSFLNQVLAELPQNFKNNFSCKRELLVRIIYELAKRMYENPSNN